MRAFDTDVLSLILAGSPAHHARLMTVAPADRCVPVVAAAENLRGWLAAARRAEVGKGKVSLAYAYQKFEASVRGLAGYRMLAYTPGAEALFGSWRRAGVRVATHDLQFAAIAVAHGAKLATRNTRDYALVPGLTFEVWT